MRLRKEPSETTTKTKRIVEKGKKRSTLNYSKGKAKSREEVLAKVMSEVDMSRVRDDDTYKFTCLDTVPKLLSAFEAFLSDDPPTLSVDTETQGLRWEHRIIGVSFSWSDDHNYYIPIRHVGDEPQLDIDDCVPVLNEMLSFPDKNYVFHNYKFDFHKLSKEGIHVAGIVHDTMLMHYVLDENDRHSLKHLATKFVDPDAAHYSKVIGDIRRRLARGLKIKLADFGFEHIPVSIMVQYACRDTLYTLRLFDKFYPQIYSDESQGKVYDRELAILPVLCGMEDVGVYIDQELLLEKSSSLQEGIDLLHTQVLELAGCEFDLNSPTQLSKVLQNKGIHTNQYTPKGKMSTDRKALKGISRNFPFVSKLLEYRDKYKNKHTYTDPLCDFCDENSRIHCSYSQAVAVTGRLTCRSPSLQVIPRSTGIRDAFVPPSDDYLIVPIDLSQIELRLTAHYSQDPILMYAYTHDEDIHSRTAAEIFDIDIEDVNKDQRTVAKPINFGIIYGIGPSKLAETLGVSNEEAKHYIDTYLTRYSGVADFIKKYQFLAKKHGYVKNYFGRVRHLEFLRNAHIEQWQRERGYRQAVNFVIQSSAADMFKIIMRRCHDLLLGKRSSMVMNIHDEIVFYIHKEDIDLLIPIKEAFENWNFRVPITAEISYSSISWGDKQTLETV
jgi:DNA polymerase-1